MVNLAHTCYSLVSDRGDLPCCVFNVLYAYMLPHYEITALCVIRAHLEDSVSIS